MYSEMLMAGDKWAGCVWPFWRHNPTLPPTVFKFPISY